MLYHAMLVFVAERYRVDFPVYLWFYWKHAWWCCNSGSKPGICMR